MVPDVPIDGSTFDADSPVGMENLRLAMNELGGKWRLQVLWSLRSGDGLRYVGIKNTIPGITDMMLSQSLRELSVNPDWQSASSIRKSHPVWNTGSCLTAPP